MKQPLVIIFAVLVSLGCKKAIERQKENVIMAAMTNGQWVITSFISDSTDITATFEGYSFQYFSNFTVNAIKNGSVETTGNWKGDIYSMTIEANFPGATEPLVR